MADIWDNDDDVNNNNNGFSQPVDQVLNTLFVGPLYVALHPAQATNDFSIKDGFKTDSTIGCAVLWPYVLIPGYLRVVFSCKSNLHGNSPVALCMHGHSLSKTDCFCACGSRLLWEETRRKDKSAKA